MRGWHSECNQWYAGLAIVAGAIVGALCCLALFMGFLYLMT